MGLRPRKFAGLRSWREGKERRGKESTANGWVMSHPPWSSRCRPSNRQLQKFHNAQSLSQNQNSIGNQNASVGSREGENQIAGTGGSGKRVSHMSPIPAQSTLVGQQSIASNGQATQSPSQDSSSSEGDETTLSGREARKLGVPIMSKKAECIPVLPNPHPTGLLERTPIADGGQGSQGALQSHMSLGRGDANSGAGDSNQVHSAFPGKRLTDIQPTPDSPARVLIQGISNNQQAKQGPLWNSMQEGDADSLARKREGRGTLQWNTTINIENPATMAKGHPQDRAWGSIRILTGAHKPSLASLGRLHWRQGNPGLPTPR